MTISTVYNFEHILFQWYLKRINGQVAARYLRSVTSKAGSHSHFVMNNPGFCFTLWYGMAYKHIMVCLRYTTTFPAKQRLSSGSQPNDKRTVHLKQNENQRISAWLLAVYHPAGNWVSPGKWKRNFVVMNTYRPWPTNQQMNENCPSGIRAHYLTFDSCSC